MGHGAGEVAFGVGGGLSFFGGEGAGVVELADQSIEVL